METFEFSKRLLAENRRAKITAQLLVLGVFFASGLLLYFCWWNPPYPTEPFSVGYWIGFAGRGFGIIGVAIGLISAAKLR